MEYTATSTWLQQQNMGGRPGGLDRMPRPVSVKKVDPFSRAFLGKDVPGQEVLQRQTYVPLGTQPRILPGGSAESWVLFQNR